MRLKEPAYVLTMFGIYNEGFIYDAKGNVVMATTINENGKDLTYFTDEYNCLDMFNVDNPYEILEELEDSQLTFELGVFPSSIVEEATNIKLPLHAEKDLKGMAFNDRKKKINNVPHVNLWITPDNLPMDYSKYSRCWVWVELPEEQEGIKYVPIILHTSGGVSVHPYFHKYFLRAFDKRTRHLILGFCYVYDFSIVSACYFSRGKNEIDDLTVKEIEMHAFRYTDDQAPKRINAGPKPTNSLRYKPSIDDYHRWINDLKNN